MDYLIILFLGFFLGVLLCPMVLFLRARRDPAWDDSNVFNMYRVFAHLTTRPGDFAEMQYQDGRRPFRYINQDEISEVVGTDYYDN